MYEYVILVPKDEQMEDFMNSLLKVLCNNQVDITTMFGLYWFGYRTALIKGKT